MEGEAGRQEHVVHHVDGGEHEKETQVLLDPHRNSLQGFGSDLVKIKSIHFVGQMVAQLNLLLVVPVCRAVNKANRHEIFYVRSIF